MDVVTIIGRAGIAVGINVRNRVSSIRSVAHAPRNVKGLVVISVTVYSGIPHYPVVGVGNWHSLLKNRRTAVNVVDEYVFIRVHGVEKGKSDLKCAVVSGGQDQKCVAIGTDYGAGAISGKPFDGRHTGVDWVGDHHAGVEKLKAGARDGQRSNRLRQIGNGL